MSYTAIYLVTKKTEPTDELVRIEDVKVGDVIQILVDRQEDNDSDGIFRTGMDVINIAKMTSEIIIEVDCGSLNPETGGYVYGDYKTMVVM